MNYYQLYKLENGGVYLQHGSCMFPLDLQRKINEIAGQEITEHGPSLGGFFGGFVNSFYIKSEFAVKFLKEIAPKVFTESNGRYVVTSELAEANEI